MYRMVLLDQPPPRRHHLLRHPLPRQTPRRPDPNRQTHLQDLPRQIRPPRHPPPDAMGHLPPPSPPMGRQQIRLEQLAHHPPPHALRRAARRLGRRAGARGRQGDGAGQNHLAAVHGVRGVVHVLHVFQLLYYCVLYPDLVPDCEELFGVSVGH